MRRLFAALLLCPALAVAQDAAPKLEDDPRAAHFNDVERGFFVGFEVGYLGLANTPTADQAKFPLAGTSGGRGGGFNIGADIGVDITQRLSLSLIGQGGNITAGANYGAFSLLSIGADARYSFASWRDRNDWDRFFAYVHGRVSYARSYPEGLFGTSDNLLAGGVGIDYYTKLRHFSVGGAVDAVYATRARAVGVAIYPTVRYTF